MKRTIFLCAVCLVLSAQEVFGQEGAEPALRIRPIQMTSIAPLPAGLPPEMLPSGAYAFRSYTTPGTAAGGQQAPHERAGFEVTYLIEGQNIVRFDSMELDEVTPPGGTSLVKYHGGSLTYEEGRFSQTSPDGKFCVCTLRVHGNYFGNIERFVIKGQVSVAVATKLEEAKVELTPGDKRELKVGPFTLRIGTGTGGLPLQIFGAPTPIVPPTAAADTVTGVTTTAPEDLVNVMITGPLNGFLSADFVDGKTHVQSSSMWNDERRIYSMLVPKSGKLTTTIKYATDVKTVRVSIGR